MKTTLLSQQRTSFHSTNANCESNSEKLRLLTDKFDILETQEARLSLKRQAFFSDYVQDLENKVSITSEEGDKMIRRLEDEVISFHDEFMKEKRDFLLRDEKERGVYLGLGNDLTGTIEIDNENYRRKMEEFREDFEGRVEGFLGNLEEKKRARSEKIERGTKEALGIMDTLGVKLDDIKINREKKEDSMMKEFGKAIQETCEILELERNARENTEGKMKNMIKEVTESLMKDIEVKNDIANGVTF